MGTVKEEDDMMIYINYRISSTGGASGGALLQEGDLVDFHA